MQRLIYKSFIIDFDGVFPVEYLIFQYIRGFIYLFCTGIYTSMVECNLSTLIQVLYFNTNLSYLYFTQVFPFHFVFLLHCNSEGNI